MRELPRHLVLVLLCSLSATATTVVLVWTPRELFIAADSMVKGDPGREFCKIRQVVDTFFAVEGAAEISAITNGKPDTANSFDVIPLAQRAAKVRGSMSDKARTFEHESKQVFRTFALHNKQNDPAGYRANILKSEAVQVVFFGLNPNKVPAYALVALNVQEDQHGVPMVTVDRAFCPDRTCYSPRDLQLLGEARRANELSKEPGFDWSDPATAVRKLVEVERQDKPKLVGGPIDVLRLSAFGPTWVSVKPECAELVQLKKPNSLHLHKPLQSSQRSCCFTVTTGRLDTSHQ
jgi:hypothetical protein